MQPSDDPPPPAERWVPFEEAQAILGMSETTLRRAIKAGKIEAATFPRNPDNPKDRRIVYSVLVPDPPAAAPPSESGQPPPIRQEPPAPADVVATELLAMIRDQADQITGLNAQLRDETAGRASAEARADTLQAHVTDLAQRLAEMQAERDALRERERRPWWRKALGLPPGMPAWRDRPPTPSKKEKKDRNNRDTSTKRDFDASAYYISSEGDIRCRG